MSFLNDVAAVVASATNTENSKIHKRWSAHAEYFKRFLRGFLARLSPVFLHGFHYSSPSCIFIIQTLSLGAHSTRRCALMQKSQLMAPRTNALSIRPQGHGHFWQPSAQRAARGFFRPQRGDEHLRRRQHITALPRGVGGGSSQHPPESQRAGGRLQ